MSSAAKIVKNIFTSSARLHLIVERIEQKMRYSERGLNGQQQDILITAIEHSNCLVKTKVLFLSIYKLLDRYQSEIDWDTIDDCVLGFLCDSDFPIDELVSFCDYLQVNFYDGSDSFTGEHHFLINELREIISEREEEVKIFEWQKYYADERQLKLIFD